MPGPDNPHQGKGLAFKLSLFILGSTSVIFLAAFAYYHHFSRQALLREARADAANLTLASVRRIEATLGAAQEIPGLLAFTYGKQTPSLQNLRHDLTGFVLFNKAVYGSCLAYALGTYGAARPYFAPYVYRSGDKLEYMELGEDYDYPNANWFLIPKALGRAVWSEPYYDEGGGNVIMSTYSAPFYREEDGRKTFLGVVTADISLDWLRNFVGGISIYRSGYAFLLSRNGVFVSHPNITYIMRESVFSLAEQAGSPELRRIGQDMIRGGTGFVKLPGFVLGKSAWLSYAPVAPMGWSMGLVIPEDELFEELNALGRRVAGIAAVGIALLLAAVILVSTSITRPLKSLAGRAAEIARGNLDAPLPDPSSGDEVGQLARSFEDMRLALREYITNLTETTKAKERMESELKIARTIQMSFLPKRFPPFPEIPQFELHALLEPALEVGGDLFDFYLLDGERLLFLVGDVSGKGVPAALFMAVTKTLVKGVAELERSPAAILHRVNRELLVENDAMLFVTMFLGILDFETGLLTYSNAGHNPPVLIRDGQADWLALPKGLFLGVMEEAAYHDRTLTLHAGDRLVVYTDGVTEAVDPSGAFYSNQRLLDFSAGLAGEDARTVSENLAASVHAFAAGAAPADDVTVLTLHYRGE